MRGGAPNGKPDGAIGEFEFNNVKYYIMKMNDNFCYYKCIVEDNPLCNGLNVEVPRGTFDEDISGPRPKFKKYTLYPEQQ
jgi:hypothetical protein